MATPKSKDSKRKLRRWSFEIIATSADGENKYWHPPTLSIGDSQVARQAAEQMRAEVAALPNLAGADIKVNPIGHEVVSIELLRQINGLEEQLSIVTLAFKDCVEREVNPPGLPAAEGEVLDNLIRNTIGIYINAVTERQRRERLIASGIDPDAIAENEGFELLSELGTEPPAAAEVLDGEYMHTAAVSAAEELAEAA